MINANTGFEFNHHFSISAKKENILSTILTQESTIFIMENDLYRSRICKFREKANFFIMNFTFSKEMLRLFHSNTILDNLLSNAVEIWWIDPS